MNAAVNVDNVTIQINGGNQLAAIGGLVPVTLTPDSGGPISSVGANFNITGVGGLTSRKNANPNLQFTDKRFTTAFVVDPSSTFGSQGEFTTITAAVAAAAAAGGGVVFVRAGIYTENFSLPAGVVLTSYQSAPAIFGPGTQLDAVVDGQITISDNGVHEISNISLFSSTNPVSCLDFPGANNAILLMNSCVIGNPNTSIITGSNSNSTAIIEDTLVIGVGASTCNLTGASISFQNCNFVELGGTTPVATLATNASLDISTSKGNLAFNLTNSSLSLDFCTLGARSVAPIVTAGASGVTLTYSSLNSSFGGTAAVVLAGTTSLRMTHSTITSNTTPTINVGAGCTANLDICTLGSSGVGFEVVGTGNFNYGILEFPNGGGSLDPGLNIIVQTSRPIATVSGVSQHPGLAFFDSTQFTVSASGEVSATGTIPTSFVENAGSATPSAGVLNIVGAGGVTTSGAGNTVTIDGSSSHLAWIDQGVSTTASSNNGYFTTAGITLTLPAAPSQGDIIEVICIGPMVIRANAGQVIKLSNTSSAVAGSATSTLSGDAMTLIFRFADTTWHALDSVGSWTLA